MNRAIIIVDHGSTRPAANEMLEDMAAMLRSRTSEPVYAAHMEVVEPTIAQAFDAAVAAGANFIYVFPYFLSPGRHSREDIPWLCAQAAARHPGVNWHVTGPFGLDSMLADLILHRVKHCESRGYTCFDCPNARFCRPAGEAAEDEEA